MGKVARIDTDILTRANLIIAQGALTNSKRPTTFIEDVYPTHLKSGIGCHIEDTLGNTYIDFLCGLGSNLIGYGDHEIALEIYRAAIRGLSLSLGSELEVRYAESLQTFFPWIEQFKFLKTGTEACAAAVRIARAHTGREQVLSSHYHGWSDDFVSLTPPALGVPKRTCIEELKGLEQITDKTAAVIVEPVVTDFSETRKNELRALRDKCKGVGALLIFDEVITGLRFLDHSVSRHFGIEPDLICLGKALGGGLPLSAVGGKRSIMSGTEYFVSSTFAGERASLAAGLKVLDLLRGKKKISELWDRGKRFQERFNELSPDVQLVGYPTRGVFQGDEMTKALFWQESVKAGIFWGPSWFLSFPHMDVFDSVISASRDILTRIKTGEVKLEGKMPKKPFAQTLREQQK